MKKKAFRVKAVWDASDSSSIAILMATSSR